MKLSDDGEVVGCWWTALMFSMDRGVGEEVVRLLMDSGTDPRREEMKTVNLCVKVGPFSILKLT